MKVWKDLGTGDEMVSDSYPMQLLFNDACLEVKAKFTTKGSDFVAIAADDEDDGGEGETVVNIVEAHKLNEIMLSKKDVMALIKGIMKNCVTRLKENGKEDRVAGFKAGATEMVKFIIGKFDEMQIYIGESIDTENGAICFSYNKDGETDPTFLFFNDCYKEEKY